MWNKIKWNIEYILCVFCGVLTLVFLALPYVKDYYVNYVEYESIYIGFATPSIFVCLVVPSLLIFGVTGLLKKNAKFPSRKLAFVFLMIYGILNIILFLFMVICYLVWENVILQSLQVGAYLLLGLSVFEMVALFIVRKNRGYLSNAVFVCSKCGIMAKFGDKFCVKCGEKIEIQIDMGYVCSVCGKRAKFSDKFCGSCGGAVHRKIVKQTVDLKTGQNVEKKTLEPIDEKHNSKMEL